MSGLNQAESQMKWVVLHSSTQRSSCGFAREHTIDHHETRLPRDILKAHSNDSSSSSSSTLFVGTFCKGRVRIVGSSDIGVVCGSLWLVTCSKGGCSPYPQRPQKSEVAGDFSPQARQNGMMLSPHSLKNFSIINVLLKSKSTTQAIFYQYIYELLHWTDNYFCSILSLLY